MRRAMRAELGRAQACGYLRRDPEGVSDELLIAMQGLMVLGRLGHDDAAARRSTRAIFAATFPDHPRFGTP